MSRTLCKLGLLAALAVSGSQAMAELRLATVDLKKVFEDYFKTKQADAVLKERGSDMEKTLKGMLDDYQKSNEEYKKLLDSANDQAVSADERDRRKKAAESKLLDIRGAERQIQDWRKQSITTLDEEKRRKRETILTEIKGVAIRKAKAGNYTMLVDVSAESTALTAVVLYTSGENDITEEILRELNATAPPELLKSSETKEKAAPRSQENKP